MSQSKITGYRELTDQEVVLMNDCKALSSKVGELVTSLQEDDSLDQRWVSLGTSQLQQGFMALVRSIAQPSTF